LKDERGGSSLVGIKEPRITRWGVTKDEDWGRVKGGGQRMALLRQSTHTLETNKIGGK